MGSLEDERGKFFSETIILAIIMDIFFGALVSLLPGWSLSIFVFVLALIVIEIFIYAYWHKHLSNFDKYDKRVITVFISTLGFFADIPLLRMTFMTIQFWLLLIMCIFILVIPLIWSILNVQPQNKKSQRLKILIWTSICLSLLTIISLFIFRTGQEKLVVHFIMEYQRGFIEAGIMFFVGYIFIIISAISAIQHELYKPKAVIKKTI